MPALPRLSLLSRCLPLLAVAVLAGCTIAKPRTDDPLEKFNRKSYAFNDKLDKAIIRPVAVGYRKITNPPVRRSVSDFFTNIKLPITIANELLQVVEPFHLNTQGGRRPRRAAAKPKASHMPPPSYDAGGDYLGLQ